MLEQMRKSWCMKSEQYDMHVTCKYKYKLMLHVSDFIFCIVYIIKGNSLPIDMIHKSNSA